MPSPAALLLPRPVDFATAERLFIRSKQMATEAWRHQGSAEAGCRAVKARDPRVMAALEQAVESLHKAYESQLGETQRNERQAGLKVKPEVVTFYEKAFVLADKGQAAIGRGQYEWEVELVGFGYLYAAVAEFAGALG